MTQTLTTAGLASAVLLRHNELAGVLAGRTSDLLKAAGIGDVSATNKHRQEIMSWCEEQLDPTLEQVLAAADRMNEAGEQSTALAIAEQAVFLRSAVAQLAKESDERAIALCAIQLRVRLHGLMRALDQSMLGALAHELPRRGRIADPDSAVLRAAC